MLLYTHKVTFIGNITDINPFLKILTKPSEISDRKGCIKTNKQQNKTDLWHSGHMRNHSDLSLCIGLSIGLSKGSSLFKRSLVRY